MKNKVTYAVVIILALGTIWFLRDRKVAKNQTNETTQELSSQTKPEEQPTSVSNPQGQDKIEEEVTLVTNENDTYDSKLKDLDFDVEGPFALAKDRISDQEIARHFAGGITEGYVMKADFQAVKSMFQRGQVFEFPLPNGKAFKIYPSKTFESPNQVYTFIGSTQDPRLPAAAGTQSQNGWPETSMTFVKGQLTGGSFFYEKKKYAFATGPLGTYLVRPSDDAFYDRHH